MPQISSSEPRDPVPAATGEYAYFATITALLRIRACNDQDARRRLANAITGGDALDLERDDPDVEFSASCTLAPEDLELFEINDAPAAGTGQLDRPGRALPPGVAIDSYTVTGHHPADDPFAHTPRVHLERHRGDLFGDDGAATWLIRGSQPAQPIWNYQLGDWDYPQDPDPTAVFRPFSEALTKARALVGLDSPDAAEEPAR